MKNKKLKISLNFLTVFLAALCWWMVQRAIMVADSSVWLVPIISFSCFFIVLCLNIILSKEMLSLELLLAGAFFLNFFFVLNLGQFIFLFFGMIFIWLGIRKIKKDMDLNIKLDLTKSLQTGRSLLIFGIVLIIVGQYFFTLQKVEGQKNMPQFEVGKNVGEMSLKIMAAINPEFKSLENENITVDEFILHTQKEQVKNIDPAMQNILLQNNQELILAQGRKQLAEMTGKNLQGNEQMSSILASFINKKINEYFAPTVKNPKQEQMLPAIYALVLLFTIWPIGAFLSYFWILIADVIFLSFRRTQIVGVKKIPVEMEVIE